jgi:peptide/nickel transport system substrate-binding protein
MKKRGYAFIVGFIVTGLLLLPCFQEPASTATPTKTPSSIPGKTTPPGMTPKYGGVLKQIVSLAPTVFGYPPEIQGINLMHISHSCLEPLASMDLMGKYTPTKLSTNYRVAPDGKSMTFVLRKGVKFHDGTDWNAQAAKWNLDRQMAAKRAGTEYMTSVDVVDDYTIRINLNRFQNNIVTNLATTTGMMISPTAVERNGLDWARVHPVGTGPFKFKSFQRDVSLEYERFDDYWGGKPYLEGFKYLFIVDPMTQAAAFQSGEADMIQSRNTTVSSQLISTGKYDMIWGISGLSTFSPDSANADSPFANLKVREAVQYAIDRKAIVDALGHGLWKFTNQSAPPGAAGYINNFEGRPYNPQKAKQLLAEAGYPNGFTTSIITNQTEVPKEVLESMQQYLGAVGITANLRILPQPAWNELVLKGWNNGLIYWGVGMNPNYASALMTFFGPGSVYLRSLRKAPGWAEALNRALDATDYENIRKYTEDAVKFAHDDAMNLFMYAYGNPYFQHKYVHDSGYYAVGHFMAWTPEKCWLSK